MNFWLAAICIISLNFLTPVTSSKKEDLERAAELAVERAAERVAERAVEKALEAGNSSTTTVTVKEGYSNARKVAEEQAAPGSQSTRYDPPSPYVPEYSAEYHPGGPDSTSAEYENPDENIAKNDKTGPKEEPDFDWYDDGGSFGLKEPAQMQSKKSEPSEDSYREEEVEEGDDDLYPEEDSSQEKEAWKAYSNWESNFKKAPKENWNSGKSFWSGEDSFFWDMEDAETRNNVKKVNATDSDARTDESQNHESQVRTFPREDFFWNIEQKYSTSRPEPKEKDDQKIYTFHDYKKYWTDKQTSVANSWKDRANVKKAKEPAKSSSWKDDKSSEAPPKDLWQNHENFQADTWPDEGILQRHSWSREHPSQGDSWQVKENQNNHPRLKEEKSELDFWMDEDHNDGSKKKKDSFENDSWESKEFDDDNSAKTKDGSMMDVDITAEISSDDSVLYSLLKGKNYGPESTDPTAISKRSAIHNDKRSFFQKNKTYPITLDHNRYKRVQLRGIQPNKEELPSTSENYYGIDYDSSVYEPESYRPTRNRNIPKVQVPAKAPANRRQKLKPVAMDTYTRYVLNTYKPYVSTYEYYLNQLRYQNQHNPYRVKKQVPFYTYKNQHPYINNVYK